MATHENAVPPPKGDVSANCASWNTLAAEYPNDERLLAPTIYALPTKLLTQIRKFAPALLSAKNLQFERRLRALAGTGFQDRQPFGCELLDTQGQSEVHQELYGDPLTSMFQTARLASHGETASTSDGLLDLARCRQDLIEASLLRRRGYTAWLITNTEFRKEAEALQDVWVRDYELVSSLPNFELLDRAYSAGKSSMQLDQLSNIIGLAKRFLKKWNLSRMQTWSLPVPVSEIYLTDETLPTNEFRSMGASIFVPWSMLAVQELNLREIVDYHYARQGLSHLRGWTDSTLRKSWGIERHAQMLQLFVYIECAIKTRYPEHIEGNLSKLDTAFAVFWDRETKDKALLEAGADKVRKSRLEMQRRLKKISGEVKPGLI